MRKFNFLFYICSVLISANGYSKNFNHTKISPSIRSDITMPCIVIKTRSCEKAIVMKEIPLNTKKRRKNIGYVTIVSDEDYEALSKYSWSLLKRKTNNYARAIIGGTPTLMHRLILGLTDPKIIIDHADTNGLNNQRSNLRIATKSQNNSNRKPRGISQYLGVTLQRNKYWCAAITANRKRTHLGSFKSEIEAAKCFDEAAKKYYGEFANLNFK